MLWNHYGHAVLPGNPASGDVDRSAVGPACGCLACVLLVMGGLGGLQTASILAAAPFLLVMVGLCVSLWMGLLDDIEVHGHFEELGGKIASAEAEG